MKIYKKKIIPAYETEYVKSRKCDLCGIVSQGEKWEARSCYTVNETEVSVEVKQKKGSNLPDSGYGTKYEIDLCPNCFKEKLIPWLESQGAIIRKEDWNW